MQLGDPFSRAKAHRAVRLSGCPVSVTTDHVAAAQFSPAQDVRPEINDINDMIWEQE